MNNEINLKIAGADLVGGLSVPTDPAGLVIFGHSSNDGRKSPRNVFASERLNSSGMATFLFDLLTSREDLVEENHFNIDLLTDRLVGVTKWCMDNEDLKKIPIGYYGASTGAAAVLSAAAFWGSKIKAVVCRGGRPDLAGEVLDLVESPTLLIVGGADRPTINFNRQAYIHIGCEKKTEIIPGASHLFDEEGALEKVVELSTRWFLRHFSTPVNIVSSMPVS